MANTTELGATKILFGTTPLTNTRPKYLTQTIAMMVYSTLHLKIFIKLSIVFPYLSNQTPTNTPPLQ